MHTTRKTRMSALAVAALTVMALLLASVATATQAGAVAFALTDAVRMRNEPTGGSAYTAIAPRGSIIDIVCQQWGEPQGPNGNTLWLKVNGSGRNGWWVSDAWTNSPHLAADKTVGINGVTLCNAGSTPPPPPPAGLPAPSMDTKVWVGAPFAGRWAGSSTSTGSLPQNHNPVFSVPGHSWVSDWAMDYYGPAGTPVKLFVAPKDDRLNSRITAQVLDVRPTCKRLNGETSAQQLSRGGYAVFVGVFDGGVRVGTVSYSHVSPAFAADYRGNMPRWGGDIGTVGQYSRNSCWNVTSQAGHHVHAEFSNENQRQMSCYRPGVPQNASLTANEYIGYLGGAFASQRKQACPTGA